MPCPLYSKQEQACLLINQAAVDDDDDAVGEAERIRHDLCLGDGKEYLACPVFRRRTIEGTKAY